MAQAKSVKFLWQCEETGMSRGIAKVNRAKLKELPKAKKYNKRLRRKTWHKAKEAKG